VCALVPAISLRRLLAPTWLAFVAAILVFPGLPLAWHVLAERNRRAAGADRLAPLRRFGLRSLAVGLVVLGVSMSTLGPRRIGRDLLRLVRQESTAPAPAPIAGPGPSPRAAASHELESFIPADASLVLALSDSAVMQQLLAAGGVDTASKLAALEKCQIALRGALVVMAARAPTTRMVVVRAAGVTDPRNLYCLVGFLGSDRLKLRFTSDKAPVRFDVEGLMPRTLSFVAVDDRTVVAADAAWQDTIDKKLFAEGQAHGPLGAVIERIDRGASLWCATSAETDKGRWDLALDARFETSSFKLRASSTSPSGEKAELEMRVPLTFAAALPQGALKDGIRGVVSVIAATGAGLEVPPGQSAPTPPRRP
jgi:hypothetical protein